MTTRKIESKFSKKQMKNKDYSEIPKSCYKCAWRESRSEEKSIIAKIKCNNKEAMVLQQKGIWVCYSFTTYIDKKNKKEVKKVERKS